MFSVSACNTLVTPVTLRCLKGQTGVSGQTVTKFRNFIIKPLIWLQGCQNEIENTDLLTYGLTAKKTDVLPASPESDGYWVSVSPEPSPEIKPAEIPLGHDLKNVALGRSVGGFKTTPSSSPSPAPPEGSPTADERAEALQLQNSLLLAASDLTVVGECRPVRKLVKQEEPSLVRSGTQPPGDTHFWPIFAGADGGKMSIKRDAPDRMPDAPISGDGDADGADGANRVCCLALTIGRR